MKKSEKAKSMKRPKPRIRISSTGAFLILVFLGAFILGIFMNIEGSGSGEFNRYSGPVLPMTSLNGAEGVDVTRNVNFDFSPYQNTNEYALLAKGAAGISDTYVLTNTTGEHKTLELVYGFQGSFIDHSDEFPTITVNGVEIHPRLYPSVDMEERIWHANNFDNYSRILEENNFLGIAIQQPEELDIPVMAYHFTELSYNGTESALDPMLILRFSLDENTTVWTMGADAFGTEDDGRQRMMFRVDGGEAWILTMGGSLIDPVFIGNKDFNITETSALDGITYKQETFETTLADAIWKLAQKYDFWAIDGFDSNPNSGFMTPELLMDGAVQRIWDYQEPFEQIRLIDGLFYDVITEPRMMYLVFPVELGAGESITVEASYIQEPSRDISGPKNYREGYDLATKLGSNLNFTVLTSSLSNTNLIELGKENFGFDLKNGITEVNLDLQIEHYYLEVKIKK